MNQTQVNNLFKCLTHVNAPPLAVDTIKNSLTALTQADGHDHKHADHDHEHEHSSDESELLVAKITAMTVLFCASSLCGCIPFLLNRCFKWTERNENARSSFVVKFLLYFGGGVLLSTTFLHLLPEVQEAVGALQKCSILPNLTFPLAEMLMCLGFFLMYLIEESMHAFIRYNKRLECDDGAGAAFERGQSVRNSYLVRRAKTVSQDDSRSVTTESTSNVWNGTNVASISVQDLITNDLETQKQKQNHQSHHNHTHHAHLHLPAADDVDSVVTSSLRGLFIVLALSLHELFEGMAIGLEGDASSVWFMFGAVSAHKLVLAFCVGVELIVARTRHSLSFVYIFTFAVVSPIGIGIGILISQTEDGDAPSLPAAIMQGLACGTLLYVVFFEILSHNNSGLGAYLALIIGFAVMFGLQQLGTIGGGHSHGSCGSHDNDHHHNHAHG